MHRLLLLACLVTACYVPTTPFSVVDAPPDARMPAVSTYIKASNAGANDQFGFAMAMSADGTTLAVSAPFEDSATVGVNSTPDENAVDAGAVYVFVRSGDTWIEQAYIKASNTGTKDLFGWSLALSANGNTLLVGARYEDSSGKGPGGAVNDLANDAGAAYVYVRTDTTWAFQAYLKASNTDAEDRFGSAVALSASGDVAAVGAVLEASNADNVGGDQADNTQSGAGAAYVFRRSTTGAWGQKAYIKASNSNDSTYFGNALALSGDGKWLVVGAYAENSNAKNVGGDQLNILATNSGAAYVYGYNMASDSWSTQAYLKASNTEKDDEFGVTVAMDYLGDRIAVGAFQEDGLGPGINGSSMNGSDTQQSGAVYTFTRTDTSWSPQAYIKASNPGVEDRFGAVVAMNVDGTSLIVGAAVEDSSATTVNGDQQNNDALDSGAAYTFARADELWSQADYLKAPNTETGDSFGRVVIVSGSGTSFAVSAHLEDSAATGIDGDRADNSATNSGAVYVFE